MANEQAERLFFKIAVKRGYLTPADVRRCQERAERARSRGRSASATGMALREGLIDAETHHRIMQRVLRRQTSERLTAEAQLLRGPAGGAASPGVPPAGPPRSARPRRGARRTGLRALRRPESRPMAPEGMETTETLESCPTRTSPLDAQERSRLLARLGGPWELVEDHHLEASFSFADLGSALAFVGLLGRLAMDRGREPDLHLHGREVQVAVWTEALDGLCAADFDFATGIQRLHSL